MNTGNQKVFIVPTSNAGSSASLSSGSSESSNSNLLEDDNVSRNSSSSSSSTSSLLCSDSDDENENNERQEVSHSAIIPGGKDLSAMLSRNKENIENDDEGSEEEENSVTDDVQMKDMIGGEDERENNGIVTTTGVAMEDNKISTNVFSVNSSPSFEDDGDVNMEEVNAVEKEISQREQGKKRNNTNIAKSSPKKIIKLRMAENQEKELEEKQQDSTTKSPTNNNNDKTPLLKKEEEKASDENNTTKKSDEESKKKSSSEKTKKKKKKSKSSNKSKSTQQSESNNANNNSSGSSSLSINHNGFYPVKMPVIVSPGLLVPAVSTNSSSTNNNSSNNNTDTNNTTTPSTDDNLINIKKPSASDKEKTSTNKNNNSDNTTNKNTTNNSTSKQLNPSNSSSLYNSEHKITPSNLFDRAIFIASQNNATSTVSPLVIAPSSNNQEEQQQQKQEKQNHEPQHRGSSIKRKVEDMFDRDVMMTPDFPTLLPPEWMSNTYNSKEQIRITSGEKDDDGEETKYTCYSEQTKSLIQDISRYLSVNNNKDEASCDMECDDDDDANNDKPCLQFRDMVPISLITEYPPSYVNAHKEYTDRVIERERIIEDNQIAVIKAQEAYIQFEEDKEEWTIQMKKIESEQLKQKEDEDKQNEQQQDISSKSSSHQPSCISAMPEQPPNKPILKEIPPIPLEPPKPDKDDVMTTSSKTLKKSLVSSYLDPDFYSKPTRPYFGLLSNSIADPQFIGPNAPGLTLSSNTLLNHSNTLDTARTNNNTVSAHGGGKGNLFYGYYSQAPTHLMISSSNGQKKRTK